jgi:hypothetical protein
MAVAKVHVITLSFTLWQGNFCISHTSVMSIKTLPNIAMCKSCPNLGAMLSFNLGSTTCTLHPKVTAPDTRTCAEMSGLKWYFASDLWLLLAQQPHVETSAGSRLGGYKEILSGRTHWQREGLGEVTTST